MVAFGKECHFWMLVESISECRNKFLINAVSDTPCLNTTVGIA